MCGLWVATFRFRWQKHVKSTICFFLDEFIFVSCIHVLILDIQDLQPKVGIILQKTFVVLLVKLVGNMTMSIVLSDSHNYFFKVYYILLSFKIP